jgi:5-methyltetrahydrofolate--homocysteine methyltransferase
VGVVLACNNFDIVDLGVMVPTEKILQTAIDEEVDVIGLSGLITPSLDEMIYVAQEMQRRGLDLPLMIGGATTSRAHTAVKIFPEYENLVVHVNDASRSVPVAQTIAQKKLRPAYHAKIKEEYTKLRENYLNKSSSKRLLSIVEARANALQLEFKSEEIIRPSFLGRKELPALDLAELRKYIDWTPFFQTWQLAGRFPRILQDEVVGEEATKLFQDAQAMLDQIIAEQWIEAKAVFGFWEAQRRGADDIQLYENGTERAVFHGLRQQTAKAKEAPNIALADFIAPPETQLTDYVGCFAVTAGLGIEKQIALFEVDHDDYNSILLKALADRLAEAAAEWLHEQVRKKYWGYNPGETLENEDLIKEKYQGIRPAPGYPACPDHLEKNTIFELLDARSIGMDLTSSLAMTPAASVSGYYFAHPLSRYFGLGKIDKSQVEDYAERRGISVAEAEKWLRPNLNY